MAEHANLDRIETVGGMLAERFEAGNKALICGNGGSVCDAMHFAEELTGRFRNDRRPLPAIACTDAGHITCVANDYGFEDVFARWVEALGNKGDVLIALSTSGDSRNVLRGGRAQQGHDTVAFKHGGLLRGQADHEWIIRPRGCQRVPLRPHPRSPHARAAHDHRVVERRLFPELRFLSPPTCRPCSCLAWRFGGSPGSPGRPHPLAIALGQGGHHPAPERPGVATQRSVASVPRPSALVVNSNFDGCVHHLGVDGERLAGVAGHP